MLQRREALADFRLALKIELRCDTTPAARQALHDAAPIVNDHAVAVGFTAVGVKSRLRRGDDITEIFDRTGAQQSLPVGASGRAREGRRYCQDLCAGCAQTAKQLRKSDVIADGQTETADG